MLKKLLMPAAMILGLLGLVPLAQARVQSSNPDHYMYIPPHYDISCQQARVLIQREGYRLRKTIRCGGNYYKFWVERWGFDYIVQVMTSRGKRMTDARSGSKGDAL